MSFVEPHQAAEQRRLDVARINSVTGGNFDIEGHVLITGIGEAQCDVTFPVRFIELPVFTFGYSLDDSQAWTSGDMPTCSGVVGKWMFEIRRQTGNRAYTGATLLVVVTGLTGQYGYFHYRFTGRGVNDQ